MADFLKGGGKLGSGIRHHESGVLQDGDCNRTVDGIGLKLIDELRLGSGSAQTASTNQGVASERPTASTATPTAATTTA